MHGAALPLLPTVSAHFLAGVFALTYVGSIYASKSARLRFAPRKVNLPDGQSRLKLQNERWRNDPDVIRARLLAVSSATLICCLYVFIVVKKLNGDNNIQTVATNSLRLLGCRWSNMFPLLITPLLYAGPLFVQFLERTLPFQGDWDFRDDVIFRLFSIVGLRNYIVAPITEEIVFRACVLSVYHLAGASRKNMIFLSPFVFGAAHIHHAWETYHRYGRTSTAAKRAIISTIIQFTYTSVFGSYCCYLFLRSGSLLPPIAAHIFCNIMGVPQPGYEMSMFADRKLSIAAMYLLGITGFVFALTNWSYTSDSLYWQ